MKALFIRKNYFPYFFIADLAIYSFIAYGIYSYIN